MSTIGMDDPDFLIIGGGSAGATLAARLSEDPASRVLLVEAGPDTPPDAVPDDVADIFPTSSLNPGYFWPGLTAARRPGGTPIAFPQARIMGGGSSVMGMWALRALPSDFAAWTRAAGWTWEDALRLYRGLEHDLDRDQRRNHPEPPPYPIRRVPRTEWPTFAAAIEAAAARRGLAPVDDINETPGRGVFAMPVSQDAHGRASTARCYLTAAVRRRPNLAILADTQVTALRFDGRRASGAVVRHEGVTREVVARQVILCAGALHSPAQLLRAGIGPAADLQALGIAPLADRQGVGRNLQNHPYLQFAITLPRRSRMRSDLRHFALAGIRLSSGMADCPDADLLVYAIGRVSPHRYGTHLGMVGAALYAPFSRGRVTLASVDPDVPPQVAFNLLQDPRDPPRLLAAARFAEALLTEPAVRATYNDAFLLPPVMALQQFNQPGLAGTVIAAGITTVLNAPPAVCRWALNRALAPGRWFANRRGRAELADDEILGAAAPMAHPAATCALGRADDPMAVVDRTCRVIGVDGLRVVDASVMPAVPSANTNLTTIMIAERAAELIRAQAR